MTDTITDLASAIADGDLSAASRLGTLVGKRLTLPVPGRLKMQRLYMDEPTVESISAAKAACLAERMYIEQVTGVHIDEDGKFTLPK